MKWWMQSESAQVSTGWE